MAENSRKQQKQHKKQLKIAKKLPKHHSNHWNYLPIRAPDQNQSWIPENMQKKKQQNGQKWRKIATKTQKMGQKLPPNHEKSR